MNVVSNIGVAVDSSFPIKDDCMPRDMLVAVGWLFLMIIGRNQGLWGLCRTSACIFLFSWI